MRLKLQRLVFHREFSEILGKSAVFTSFLLNFFMILLDSETNEININWEDEIVTGTALTKNGEIVHEGFNK